MTSYLSHLVYTGSHEKRETRMGTSGYDVYDVYLWILICMYSVVSHPCVIISMLALRVSLASQTLPAPMILGWTERKGLVH